MEGKFDKFLEENKNPMLKLTKLCSANNETLKSVSASLQTLDTKVKSFEQKLSSIDGRLTQTTNKTNAQIGQLTTKVNECEKSTTFLSTKYDDLKKKCDDNTVQIHALKQNTDNLHNELANEKIGRNDDQQYFRSAFYLKIHGIPWQEGEQSHRIVDDKKVRNGGPCNQRSLRAICDLFDNVGIENFDSHQVDCCHRTSAYYLSPIIVMFQRKADRENVFHQKNKLARISDLDYDTIGLTMDDAKLKTWRDEQAVKIPTKDWSNEYPRMVIREHLTSHNNDLLKAVLPVARAKQYKHPGYLSKGRIHVRKTDSAEPIQIVSSKDLDKIV